MLDAKQLEQPEIKRKRPGPKKGHVWSAETKEKMRVAALGNAGAKATFKEWAIRRKIIFTPDMIAEIHDGLRLGRYQDMIAHRVGVSVSTLRRGMREIGISTKRPKRNAR